MQTLTVLIMTPLHLEYQAMRKHLTERVVWVEEGAVYEKGRFQGQHYAYEVIIAEPGMKNTDMALATERAIQRFNPAIAILCGIAGGIKDVRKGDVAIARSAFNYDAGKESDNGFLPRPAEYHFSDELLAYAQLVQRSDAWKQRTADGAPDARIHLASVAAGDKVVAAVNNTTFQRLEQYLSHCKFLEMEAAGFGLAVQRHRGVHALVVRGISDLCADKAETDKEDINWQAVAAERAAAVVGEVMGVLQNLSFITPVPEETSELLLSAEFKAKLRQHISKGRSEQALDELVTYTKDRPGALQSEVLALSDRWKELSRKSRMFLISNDEAILERNRIVAGLLALVGG